jgi:hypothetical protein
MDDNKSDKIDQASLEGETLDTAETKQPGANEVIKPDGQPADEKQDDTKNDKSTEIPKAKANEPKTPALKRLRSSRNLYLAIFIVLFAAACIVVVAAVRINNKNNSKNTSTSESLSSSDLAKLSGTTTVVGDSKQTLDIQSAAIFEGQVLMRGELNVAGALKVGGSLSLPGITAGSGSFGQLQVNDTFTASGNATVQGQLSVQKNLSVAGSGSFGTLSAAQLNVTNLQFNGDISVNRHISPGGGTPSKSNGSALGGGGTASVSGSDTAGTVSINTGSGPPAGCFVTINFAQKFNTTPHIVISPSNSSAGSLDYYTNRSNTSFSVCTASAPAAATNYIFDYIAFD